MYTPNQSSIAKSYIIEWLLFILNQTQSLFYQHTSKLTSKERHLEKILS